MKEKTIKILVLIGFIILAGAMAFYFFNALIQVGMDLEACKEAGYKGIKFVSKWSNEYYCSN